MKEYKPCCGAPHGKVKCIACGYSELLDGTEQSMSPEERGKVIERSGGIKTHADY